MTLPASLPLASSTQTLSEPPLSAFFGGFEPWLDFRVKASLLRVKASLTHAASQTLSSSPPAETLLLRAKRLSLDDEGVEIWALCDGENPPLPFLCSLWRDGKASAGYSWINGDPIQSNDGDYFYPDDDGFIARLRDELQNASLEAPDMPNTLDILLSASEPVLSSRYGEPRTAFELIDGEPEPTRGLRKERLGQAWARVQSEPHGAACKSVAWRLFQGEQTVQIGMSASALTRLELNDLDPEAHIESNMWGMRERLSSEHWLIEPDGSAPFLLERESWFQPYDQIDDGRGGMSLRVKGQTVWSSYSDMDEDRADKDNLFTRIALLLPPVQSKGFDFSPGAPVRIELPDLLESDASPWVDLLASSPDYEDDSPAFALLAASEAFELKRSLSEPEALNPPSRSPARRV